MSSRIVAYRGEHVETEHQVSIAVVRPDGALYAWAGDPAVTTPLRSAAKPAQALALFESGARERFAVSDEELALACASHQGTARHVAIAAGLLARLGLGEEALACGGHPPLDEAAFIARAAAGDPLRTPLANNCSGKHAAMLASALALGAPTDGYLDPRHPLQVAIRGIHQALIGPPRGLTTDGCSAPCWVFELRQLAHLYALLAAPAAAPATLAPGLRAARDAMRAHPELVGGEGVLDTRLMGAIPGLVGKRGADGVYALGLLEGAAPGAPLGIAIKVHDGSGDARTAAVLHVLGALLGRERTAASGALSLPTRTNWRGTVVGHWAAELELCHA